MTLQTLARGARHSNAGLLATAALFKLNTDPLSLRRHKVHGPAGIYAAAAPKPAVCVLVPKKTEIDDDVALKLLTGSTMNGRYVDKAAAKKVLATTKTHADQGTAKKTGAGKGTPDIKKVDLGHGMDISHHSEPRRSIGLRRRGQHLALDD